MLEGSVRRIGDQVRINTQLIDATTGGHVWAERYDGKLENIFVVQDSIMAKVVDALELHLTEREREQQDEGPKTANLEAYDLRSIRRMLKPILCLASTFLMNGASGGGNAIRISPVPWIWEPRPLNSTRQTLLRTFYWRWSINGVVSLMPQMPPPIKP